MCKKSICLAWLIVVLGLVGSASAGLAGHWSLDEGSGTVAQDSSDNRNHGTLMGDPQWVAGYFSNALEFDGVDDWVEVPHHQSLTVSTGVTVAAWINAERYTGGAAGADWQGIIAKGEGPRSYSLYTEVGGHLHFSTAGVGTVSTTVVPLNEWVHVVAIVEGGEHKYYMNGEPAGTGGGGITLPGTADVQSVVIGRTHEADREFLGMIDEVYIYDRPLTEAQIKDLVNGIGAQWLKAQFPDPADGATGVIQPLLQWTPGETAISHDLYFGTDPEAVASADATDTTGIYRGQMGWTVYWHGAGITPNVVYYWRVDEVQADGPVIEGDVWSFTAAPVAAYDPAPPDGAKHVPTDVELTWSQGATATSHDVYFGTDEAEVAAGTGDTSKGNFPMASYAPVGLVKETTYYWRIDEKDKDGKIYPGEVWSFTTVLDIPIGDPNLVGWWKLDTGTGTTALDWSGYDNYGALIGGPQWVPGYDGEALEFDGFDDYVEVPHNELLTVDNEVTVMAWIKAVRHNSAGGDWQAILAKGNAPRSYSLYTYTNGTLHFSVGPGGAYIGSNSTGQVPLNEWVHVCAMVIGGSHQYYINGLLAGTGGGGSVLPGTGDVAPVRIGLSQEGGNHFLGMIDDARVYRRALTMEEVKDAMRGDPTVAWSPDPANGATADIEGASVLTWKAGEIAVQHDVYFGTDRDAVADADTSDTTGVYRARQGATSYVVPEALEWGGRYFWRVDEQNGDATVSPGRLWSFTVADYLIIDDFEDYNDYSDRIFYYWLDGWGYTEPAPGKTGNGTGSTVGYLQAPFAEQTIVHSGLQSMPLEYNNTGADGKARYSEAEYEWPIAQDLTRRGVKALTLYFYGNPPAFMEDPPGTYKINAGGADIWGTSDEFRYVYKQLTGDGEISARVASIGPGVNNWAKAGVMMRDTLDAGSQHMFMAMTASEGGGIAFQGRQEIAGSSTSFHGDITAAPPHWVKLTRVGDTITAYHSANGVDWELFTDESPDGAHANPIDVAMGATIFVGMAVTSHDAATMRVAEFTDVSTVGSVAGAWQVADIGVEQPAGNSPQPMYIVLEDSTGANKMVPHDSPGATGLGGWNEWNIEIAEFAPVNLNSIKKMYIGVGNRTAPSVGGTGMLFIDDLRLYRPRCVPSEAQPDNDLSGDCIVDLLDVEIMAGEWLSTAAGLAADLDADDDVDFADYADLADTWLEEMLWPTTP